jgi:hypothetical protein
VSAFLSIVEPLGLGCETWDIIIVGDIHTQGFLDRILKSLLKMLLGPILIVFGPKPSEEHLELGCILLYIARPLLDGLNCVTETTQFIRTSELYLKSSEKFVKRG